MKLTLSALSSRTKTIILIAAGAIVLAVLALVVIPHFSNGGEGLFSAQQKVYIVTPDKKRAADNEPFTLDVALTSLGEGLFPAASLSVNFDPSKLEFLGIEEGNVMTLGDAHADGGSYQLPEWSVNIERSNEIGQINALYLDVSGGRYAFVKDSVPAGGGVLIRLSFRLRGSAMPGDIYELEIADAVFASSNDEASLASANGTLKTANGRIVVGD